MVDWASFEKQLPSGCRICGKEAEVQIALIADKFIGKYDDEDKSRKQRKMTRLTSLTIRVCEEHGHLLYGELFEKFNDTRDLMIDEQNKAI